MKLAKIVRYLVGNILLFLGGSAVLIGLCAACYTLLILEAHSISYSGAPPVFYPRQEPEFSWWLKIAKFGFSAGAALLVLSVPIFHGFRKCCQVPRNMWQWWDFRQRVWVVATPVGLCLFAAALILDSGRLMWLCYPVVGVAWAAVYFRENYEIKIVVRRKTVQVQEE